MTVNMDLAYRCQMLKEPELNSRSAAERALLFTGWNRELLASDLDAALAWAKSQRLVAKQEKYRRTRQANKTKLKSDDALDAMFSSMGADPAEIPRRKEFDQRVKGNAVGHTPASRDGESTMALGMNFNSGGDGGDIVPYVKYDSRAGRISRADRSQGSDGSYGNDVVDITANFKAVIDMDNIEIGYFLFTAGAAPQMIVVQIGQVMPQKPAGEGWKQGARVMMKLHQSCGGDVREMSGNAASFLRGFDELHTAYEAGKSANPGKLPIVVLKSAQPVTTGQGAKKSTNYQPVFEITGWAPRPPDLIFVSKAAGQKAAPATAPSTGSKQVGAPATKEMAGADDFG